MAEIILDCGRHILIIDGVEYKYFEINWGYHGDVPLYDICALDGNSVITGVIKRKDIVCIND